MITRLKFINNGPVCVFLFKHEKKMSIKLHFRNNKIRIDEFVEGCFVAIWWEIIEFGIRFVNVKKTLGNTSGRNLFSSSFGKTWSRLEHFQFGWTRISEIGVNIWKMLHKKLANIDNMFEKSCQGKKMSPFLDDIGLSLKSH